MIKTMKNLNELPVKTFKWLNVNDFSVDNISFDENIKHLFIDKNYRNIENEDYILSDDLELVKKYIDFNNFKETEKYGISDEMLEVINKKSNASRCLIIKKSRKVKEKIVLNYEFNDYNVLLDQNIIVLEEGAKATVVLKYSSNNDISDIFHNGLTKIYLNANSNLKLIVIQDLENQAKHFNSIVSFIDTNAELNLNTYELGASLSAVNYVGNLSEYCSKNDLKTIYFGTDEMKIDLSYNIIHKGVASKSNIDVKGVLDDKASKVFRGTIDFRNGCKKAVGAENENVILLSPNAKSDAIPLLLSDEEDVSGSHAATVGKIDPSKLFYIMSRGFNLKEAQKIIIEANFSEIINQIEDEKLKEEILGNIKRRFRE